MWTCCPEKRRNFNQVFVALSYKRKRFPFYQGEVLREKRKWAIMLWIHE